MIVICRITHNNRGCFPAIAMQLVFVFGQTRVSNLVLFTLAMRKSKSNGVVRTVVLTHANDKPKNERLLKLIRLIDDAFIAGDEKTKPTPK